VNPGSLKDTGDIHKFEGLYNTSACWSSYSVQKFLPQIEFLYWSVHLMSIAIRYKADIDWGRLSFQLQQHTRTDRSCCLASIADGEDELIPLVVKRLASNISALGKGVANMVLDNWYIVCELHGNTCEELAGMADISTAS